MSIQWPDDDGRGETPAPRRRNGPLVFVLLLVMLALVLWFFSPDKPGRGGPVADDYGMRAPTHAFYWDDETGQLQRYPVGEEPSASPQDAAGPAVRANVFRRGFGVDKGEPFVGYLEKPAPGVSRATYEASKRNYGPDWGRGMLVRRPSDTQWVPADSPEGRAIISEAYGTEEKCQQGRMVYSR